MIQKAINNEDGFFTLLAMLLVVVILGYMAYSTLGTFESPEGQPDDLSGDMKPTQSRPLPVSAGGAPQRSILNHYEGEIKKYEQQQLKRGKIYEKYRKQY